jgi:hypothetical protein
MGVTRKLGVHRRTVREAGRNAVPPQRKKTERPAVKTYVERRKHALGLAEHEVFVPQSYDWRVAEQVDWYEGYADLDGEQIKLQVFSMLSMASGAASHRAYPCATQQTFLEAHELVFEYFEGVFRRLR